MVDESNEPKKSTYFITTSGEDSRTQFPYYPRQNYGSDSILLSCLYKLDLDTLILVDTLNYDPKSFNRVSYMRHFDAHKWILWHEKMTENNKEKYYIENEQFPSQYISVLDYSSDSIVIRRVDTDSVAPSGESWSLNQTYLNGSELYFDFSADLSKNNYGSYALEKNLDNFIAISEDMFLERGYSKYESGPFYRKFRGFPFSPSDHKLKYSYYKLPPKLWPDASVQLPYDSLNGVIFSNFKIFYDTPDSQFMIGSRYEYSGRKDSSGLIFVYNKSLSKWDTILLPLYVSTFNVYNEKLVYGTAFEECYFPKCNRIDSILSFRKSNASKYSEKFGFTPSVANLTGVVFFLDLPSLSFTEITLSDIDSELLLIQDNFLYYRVYDKIYKSYIDIKNPTIDESTSELLVQDREVVPNIHHMFLHGG